ncbi:hypothetical protein NLL50_10710, partial [Corynebacterium propinquum]|uniref:hypothetical protein n=1 Tax=Corynebacterium propinquum TaxID=43769 RepID=UPI00266ED06E
NNKYIDTLLSSHTTPPPCYSTPVINQVPFSKAARPTLHTKLLEHKPEHCVVDHNTANQTATQATSETHPNNHQPHSQQPPKASIGPIKLSSIPARQTKHNNHQKQHPVKLFSLSAPRGDLDKFKR